MAIQKTLDVMPTSTGVPAVTPPNDTAQGVAQLAGIATDAFKSFAVKKKKEAIEEELVGLGQEVFAARAGEELKGATKRFERLRAAQKQGILSDTYVTIETEKLLKEAIGRAPGFAPELRRHAADILGFDPTGSQIRSLYNVGKKAAPQTFADKQMERAQFVAESLGVDVKDVVKLQAKNMLMKNQADVVTQQAAIGAYGRQDILNATLKEADGYISTMMGDVLGQVNQGGVSEPEQVMGNVQAGMFAQKQALRDRYLAAGLNPSSADLARDLAQVDEQWEPILEMAKTGSLAEILQRQSRSLTSAMTIDGMNLFGDMALINAGGGQEAVRNYFTTIDKYGKAGQLELLQKTNPVLARTVQSIDDAKRLSAEAYKRVMGFSSGTSGSPRSADEEAAINALGDQVFYDVTKNAALDPEMKDRRLAAAKAHGQKFKVLGAYFQKGGRDAASDEEVRFVTQTFDEEYPALVDRIVADMASVKGTRDEYVIEIQGNKLVKKFTSDKFTSKPGRASSSYWSGVQQPVSEPLTTGDMKRLQAFNDGLVNGWADDLGVRPLTFLGDTLTEINNLSDVQFTNQDKLEEAIKAHETQPSMETWKQIRDIDPDFAAEVERLSRSSNRSTGVTND